MDYIQFQKTIRSLENHSVTGKRIVADDLILYFLGQEGDPEFICLWLSPIWRYEVDNKLMIGSGDFNIQVENFDSEKAYKAEFDRICSLTNSLHNATLKKVEIDSATHDLKLTFDGARIIRTFARSVRSVDDWSFVDSRQNLLIEVGATGPLRASYKKEHHLKLLK